MTNCPLHFPPVFFFFPLLPSKCSGGIVFACDLSNPTYPQPTSFSKAHSPFQLPAPVSDPDFMTPSLAFLLLLGPSSVSAILHTRHGSGLAASHLYTQGPGYSIHTPKALNPNDVLTIPSLVCCLQLPTQYLHFNTSKPY